MNPFPEALRGIREESQERILVSLADAPGKHVGLGGETLLNCASNNYLDLAQHPDLKKAASQAALDFGTGSGGARLLGGTSPWHTALEKKLNHYRPLGESLLFNTGFMANLGLVQSLGRLFRPVFSDHANHASIHDGLMGLSARRKGNPPAFHRYRHGDASHLEMLLRRHGGEKALVISETLFSMDGDLASLEDLFALQKRHGFWLLLDEAHSTLCLPGFLESRLDIPENRARLIVMGTFGKAFGGFGAYVCAPAEAVRYLINACRPFLFSTSLPPSVVAAASAALDVAGREQWRAQRLAQNAEALRKSLREEGFEVGTGHSHIIPVRVGEARTCLRWSESLMQLGVHAPAIRPPTVPPHESRLRLSLTSAFVAEDLHRIVTALKLTRESHPL